jgi:hypothetical protein
VAFKVVEIEPEEAVIITKNTSIEFSDKPQQDSKVSNGSLMRILADSKTNFSASGRLLSFHCVIRNFSRNWE